MNSPLFKKSLVKVDSQSDDESSDEEDEKRSTYSENSVAIKDGSVPASPVPPSRLPIKLRMKRRFANESPGDSSGLCI